MGYAVIAMDGSDAGAAARRAAIRPRHLPVIERWAAAGELAFAGPIVASDGRFAGSILLLEVASEAQARRYLDEEPFAQGEVWQKITLRRFTILPLPYRPLAGAPAGPEGAHHCFAVFTGAPAADATFGTSASGAPFGTSASGAPFGATPGLAAEAAAGRLLVAGAFLAEADGQPDGVLAVLKLPDLAAVTAWLGGPGARFGGLPDRRVEVSGVAALPYHPLPGAQPPAPAIAV
jgi:uncharacterized protein YciI